MVKVSNHAAKRFIQRCEKRPTAWVKKVEIQEAIETLKIWYIFAEPFDYERYIFGKYILIVRDNTIITVLNKMF